jgi:23S rRNA pseudouridine1911/1915/1917 synthase
MPSKNMLPKGQRHHSVRQQYVAQRGVEPEIPAPVPVIEFDLEADADDASTVRTFPADTTAAGLRLDQYLAQALPDISRARVQLLIDAGQVRVDGLVPRAKDKLKGGETIEIEGTPQPEPLHATPEDIPLDIVFEDKYLAVIDKPAGMMVHAGAGASDDERNRGTLVNALLFHMAKLAGAASGLSSVGGQLRPGIVHRLDKQTSGLIVVAKDDSTHRRLGEMFSERSVKKTYLALVHGHLARDLTTVTLPIARDLVRRIRMTTRRPDGRSAVSHVQVVQRFSTPYGPFTLVEVAIETGRTHQIRVHMQSLGHPVVGDFLYGAPHIIRRLASAEEDAGSEPALELERNFLHAARLRFMHPKTGKELSLEAHLPQELVDFLARLQSSTP